MKLPDDLGQLYQNVRLGAFQVPEIVEQDEFAVAEMRVEHKGQAVVKSTVGLASQAEGCVVWDAVK